MRAFSNRNFGHLAKLLVAIAMALLLHGCATPTRTVESPDVRPAQAEELLRQGRLLEAAESYLSHAQGKSASEQARLELEALGLFLRISDQPGMQDRARQLAERITASLLGGAERDRLAVYRAQLELMKGDPASASRLLPDRPLNLPSPLSTQAIGVQAASQLRLGQTSQAMTGWHEFDLRPLDPKDRLILWDQLWMGLLALPAAELQALDQGLQPGNSKGWVELARRVQSTAGQQDRLQGEFAAWQANHPAHPANPAFIQRLGSQPASIDARPGHVALLLPLTGRLGGPAQALLEGMLAAYYQSPPNERVLLRIHDTGEQAETAWTIYQQAVQEGAKLVIGPLDKAAVDLFAGQASLPVPVLALNRASDGSKRTAGLYQFGLAPEDEASDAALRAAQLGYLDAVVLAPRTELGERLYQAFRERYDLVGGSLRDVRFYAPEESDFRETIVSALQVVDPLPTHRRRPGERRLDAATMKARLDAIPWDRIADNWQESDQLAELVRLGLGADELQRRLGGRASGQAVRAFIRRVEDESRRALFRQDVSVIFLVGDPRQARLLKPQLRYFHAGRLPVLSTSHLHTGIPDPRSDQDLDGIEFTEMPWLLGGDTPQARMRQRLQETLSETSLQRPRLVALGYDAMQVAPRLTWMEQNPTQRHEGLTGSLRIEGNGIIVRTMAWGRFERGLVTPAAPVPIGNFQPSVPGQ